MYKKYLAGFKKQFGIAVIAGVLTIGMTACGAAGKGTDGGAAGTGTELNLKSEESVAGAGVEQNIQAGSEKKTGESSMKENETNETKETTEKQPEATATPVSTPSAEEIYSEMVELSLKYEGNNYRLKKVIEKLRGGEEVSLAILGGSVTEGAGAGSNDKGYAYQFADALAETYAANGREQIKYVNAGLSGTPSVLGWMRYQQDVVTPLGGTPDLLIIEFAVNDWQEPTGGRAFESMVYEALSAREDAAVICLCSVAKTGWNTQDVYLPIARQYQIPVVSMRNAVFITDSKTRISAETYFMDDYHPLYYGHQLMKDSLMNLLAKADESEIDEPAAVPTDAVKGLDFTGIIQVDSKNPVKGMKTGSFGDTDEKIVGEYFTKSAAFPNNFYHVAGTKNDPLSMKVKCKKIIVNYKNATEDTFGKADFYIDGKLVATADGHSGGGWNNCCVLLILDEEEAATHTLEVKMAEDNLDKAFTIFSISYVQ